MKFITACVFLYAITVTLILFRTERAWDVSTQFREKQYTMESNPVLQSDKATKPVQAKDTDAVLNSERRSFFESIQRDPKQFWGKLVNGTISDPHGDYWQFCAGALVAEGGEAACSEVFRYSGPGAGAARAGALLTLSANSPAGFLQFFNENRPPVSGSQADSLARELGGNRPDIAVNWALSLQDVHLTKEALKGAFTSWFEKSPGEASAWLNDNRSSFSSGEAIETIVYATRQNDPEASCSWALELQDTGIRKRELEQSLLMLSKADKDRAVTWLKNAKMDEVEKRNLVLLLDAGVVAEGGSLSKIRLGQNFIVTQQR